MLAHQEIGGVARHAIEQLGAKTLVIVAGLEESATRVYRSVGFDDFQPRSACNAGQVKRKRMPIAADDQLGVSECSCERSDQSSEPAEIR
jgi:hypothetical protein